MKAIFVIKNTASAGVEIRRSYLHEITVIFSSLHVFITNQRKNQLAFSLLAQLVSHCTSIAEVMGSNPDFFFLNLYFSYCLSSVHCCEDRFHINIQSFF